MPTKIDICTASKCDKLHMPSGHHYGCPCVTCVHDTMLMKQGKQSWVVYRGR